MNERVTLTAHNPDGHDGVAVGDPIGVRGYLGTIVESTPNSDDPQLVDLVVDVLLPDDPPAPADPDPSEPAPSVASES